MRIIINYRGKRLRLNARRLGRFSKGLGLMFKNKESENLLFEFEKDIRISIHSLFVFFPFLAIWLDDNNNVLEHRIVRPFSFYITPKKHFRRFIEIPLNKSNEKITSVFKNYSS